MEMAETMNPSGLEATAAMIKVAALGPGQVLSVPVSSGQVISLEFDPATVTVSRRDNDLLAVLPGGLAIRFEEFFTVAQTEAPPQLLLPHQSIIAADKLIGLLGSDAGELVLETVAGEDEPNTGTLPINELLTNCARTDLGDGPSTTGEEEYGL